MPVESLIKSIAGVTWVAVAGILLIFANLVIGKRDGSLFGFNLPTQKIHLVLGPVLIILTAALVIMLFALTRFQLSEEQLTLAKEHQVLFILGPLANPFYRSDSAFVSNMGYAFLIVMWWLGMHSFTYSIGQESPTPLLYGWQVLFGIVFLALGLAAMLGIQVCWHTLGMEEYRGKLQWSFLGIVIGAFLPPYLFNLGLPQFIAERLSGLTGR